MLFECFSSSVTQCLSLSLESMLRYLMSLLSKFVWQAVYLRVLPSPSTMVRMFFFPGSNPTQPSWRAVCSHLLQRWTRFPLPCHEYVLRLLLQRPWSTAEKLTPRLWLAEKNFLVLDFTLSRLTMVPHTDELNPVFLETILHSSLFVLGKNIWSTLSVSNLT